MRFFSKLTAIFNLCFILSVVFRYVEIKREAAGNTDLVLKLPWLQASFVILGNIAILVNLVFLLLYFIFFAFKQKMQVPHWIIIFNILIFLAQVYYYFIFK